MILKIISISFKAVISGLFYLFLCISAFVTWVLLEPHAINVIRPKIQNEINRISNSYRYEIDDIGLNWNNDSNSFTFETNSLDIFNKNNQKNSSDKQIAEFKKINFDFNLYKFIRQQSFITNINIEQPKIYLFNIEPKAKKEKKPIEQNIKEYLDNIINVFNNAQKTIINKATLSNAIIYLNADDESKNIEIPILTLEKSSTDKLISSADIEISDSTSNLGLSVSKIDDVTELTISFRNLSNKMFESLISKENKFKDCDINLSGNINISSDKFEENSEISYKITDSSANLVLPKYLSQNISYNNLSSEGTLFLKDNRLLVDNLDLNLGQTKVNIDGEISNLIPEGVFAPSLLLDVSLTNLPINGLDKYWLKIIAPKARKWVTTNIKNGSVKSGNAKLKFSSKYFQDLHKYLKSGKTAPKAVIEKDFINADLNVEGATVTYSDKFEKISDLNAKVSFKNNGLIVESKSAKLNKTAIKDTTISIDNLYVKPLQLAIDGNFEGYASDATSYLKGAFLNKEKSQLLQSVINSTGDAKGSVKLQMPIKKRLQYSDLSLIIEGKFTNTNFTNLLGEADFINSNFDLSLNNADVKVKGTTNLNEHILNFDYAGNLVQRKSKYTIKGDISVDDINEFKIAKIPNINKIINLELNIDQVNNSQNITGKIDATNATITVPEISYLKPTSQNAQITFSALKESDKSLNIKSFNISTDGIESSGKALISNNKIANITIDRLDFKKNSLSLSYEDFENIKKINFTAKTLDYNDFDFSKIKKNPPNSKKSIIQINGTIDQLLMKNNSSVSSVKIEADCYSTYCKKLNIDAKLGSDPNHYIKVESSPDGEKIKLKATSNNIGYFIGSLGSKKPIRDGDLDLTLEYIDTPNGLKAEGYVKMNDFRIVKTPIIGKLFTLASFRGFADLLGNQGISFQKLSTPLKFEDSILTIVGAKSAGSSIGITSEGTINFKNKTLDLNGALIPAHEVNRMLGNIPIFGKIIVGKENEGIIATNYKIKGNFKEPKISVNPLSMLTPGFLRNIFDIL